MPEMLQLVGGAQTLSAAPGINGNGHKKPNYTAETFRRTRPKAYRDTINLLSEGVPKVRIKRMLKVASGTIDAVERKRAEEISERKNRLAGVLADVAEIGAERMEQKIGKASLRDATIGTGVAVDKLLALTGQLPTNQIAILNLPSQQDREQHQRTQDQLDAIMRKLNAD